jgi:histidinol-phosphate aminotransferase
MDALVNIFRLAAVERWSVPLSIARRKSREGAMQHLSSSNFPLANEAYEDLRPYVPGKPISETERELGLTGVIKLASNENPLGPSPKALEYIREGLGRVHDYPDGGCFYLRQSLAKKYDFDPQQFILGNGTNEIIQMLVRTFIRPGEHLLYSPGSFIIYRLCAQAAGCDIVEVPLQNQRYDLAALSQAVTDRTKIIFIANPNNPSGTYVGKDEFEAFVDSVSEHVLIVLDEAYCEYVRAADYPRGFDYLQRRERFLVLRTFSKAYGLAGLRVGFGVGNQNLIDYLDRGREPFNVNSVAQLGALAALEDVEHIRRSVELNSAELPRVTEALRHMGIRVLDSQANFVFADFTPRDARDIFQETLKRGVIIRPMTGYGYPCGTRITIGTRAQNDRLLEIVEEIWSGS